MGRLDRLVRKVACLEDGEEVTYYYDRCDLGSDERPDIAVTKCVFAVEVSPRGNHRCLVARMYKGDDEVFYADETETIYRIPFIKDLQLLEPILREISRQSHSFYSFLRD